MGFFDFLKQANINQGIEEYKRTAGCSSAGCTYTAGISGKDIYQKVKMYRYNNLTMLFSSEEYRNSTVCILLFRSPKSSSNRVVATNGIF